MPLPDPVHELLDLVAVHGFYISVLERSLKHPIPLPYEAENPDTTRAAHSIETLHRWLALLDLAVAPIAVRDALKDSLPRETAEALLRYFVEKNSHIESDRDKTDCITTALYRSSPLGAKSPPETSDRYHFIVQMAQEFEAEVNRILSHSQIPPVRDEHRQLLREFEFLHLEAEDFRTFDQLMDSGIVQRVRDIKQSFGDSFYNPTVLANFAVYNAMFGKRFDELFRAATVQIKSFAVTVQDEGASIMSKLDGNITVKHLADVEESHIMQQEYGKAQEQFRNISTFKKVVDKNRASRRSGPLAVPAPVTAQAASAAASGVSQRAAATTGTTPARATAPPPPRVNTSPSAGNPIEDGKIRTQLDAIRSFMKVADKSCNVVPLVKGLLSITPAEAESLRAEYFNETSFRADYANIMAQMSAVMARLIVEQEEARAKKNSEYLWKPHADSMAYLIQLSTSVTDAANQVVALAQGRGLNEKVSALKATTTKFHAAVQQAAESLRSVGESTASAS